ncbi:MAG TPA: farnesyl diphosphate synthase [Vicinamibacterales bacterium]|nr:farnesyl diphosphate synthase [Vicinamibacterales bacterium]
MPPARSDVSAYLAELRQIVEAALPRALPTGTAPPLILEAMRYALLGGGKRLRPSLTLAVADAIGDARGLAVNDARALALPAACAVELVHTYSLVHDDLPAMDDDALRRGRPTTHVVFGDGLAILVGDGLLTEAFSALTAPASALTVPGTLEPTADQRLRAVAVLAHAAGAVGMVGGQTIDLAAAGRVTGVATSRFDAPALEDMHARKTGALIRAASILGAIVTGADEAAIAAIDAYARELGLAFQIVDDVLDVEGSRDALGKTAGKDAAAGKPTYPALHGVEASRRLAVECVERAKHALSTASIGGRLAEIAAWSLARTS